MVDVLDMWEQRCPRSSHVQSPPSQLGLNAAVGNLNTMAHESGFHERGLACSWHLGVAEFGNFWFFIIPVSFVAASIDSLVTMWFNDEMRG